MSIRLENISKYYGRQVVVNNVNLEIDNGEFFVLLGSSGSGKTTVLNMIAGLTRTGPGPRLAPWPRCNPCFPSESVISDFVFQNYALFQSMSVAENIEFGLKVRKTAKKSASSTAGMNSWS